MSSKKTCHVEESSSNEYENYEEFKQINEATPKSKRKFITNGLKLSNKKKNIPEKCLYRSISNGTKIKISCVDRNVETSVDHEDETQTVTTSRNTRQLEQGSNDTLTANDLILHKKKNTVSKKRKYSYTPKKTRKQFSYVNSDVETSVVDGDNTQRVITSSEKKKIKRNLLLDDSKVIGEVILISSGSEDNLINYGLTVPKKKKKKISSKKKKCHSKLKKRKTSYPDIGTTVVHEDDTQELISGNTENIKQEPHTEDSDKIEPIKQSSEVNYENEEKLTQCNSILSNTEKDFSKMSVYCSIPKIMVSNICFDHTNVETSVVHGDNAKVFKTSNSTKKKVQKTSLDNPRNVGEIKPLIVDNSESNDILTTNDLMLPIKKRRRSLNFKESRKTIDIIDSDYRIPVMQRNDTQRLITSCNSKNIEVESPLEDSDNLEKFEQSNEFPLRNKDKLPKKKLNMSKKKIVPSKKMKRHSIPKKTKRKICAVDSDLEKSIICNDDSQMLTRSNNSNCKELESSLNDSENEKSEQIEKSTTDGIRLLKKDRVLPKKVVRFSKSDVGMRDISDVDSNLEMPFIHEDDTQVFKISSNTRSIEQDSSLDNNIDSEEIEHAIKSNLDGKNILTTNDSILPKKIKAISKKSVHCATLRGTKRNTQNVDSNIETLVVSDIQESITFSNKRTTEEKSLLNDTENIVNVKQSIVTSPKSSEISTTDDLNLLLHEKYTPRKRCQSVSKRKKKILSNTDVSLLEKSKTNNLKSNLEYLTIHEFQPRVLVEVLNDSLLQKSSIKNLKIVGKNFDADKQSPEITDVPSISEEPPIKNKDTSNCKVSPRSNSNLELSSNINCKIKQKKLRNYAKGSNMQKYSSLSKHDNILGVHDVGSSETNKSLEQSNETTDTSQISNSETAITTTVSPYSASKKIKLCNKKNSDPPSINIDLDSDISTDIDIDWMIVDPNQLAKIDSLQKEVDMLDHVHQLRSALRTTHANYELALEILQKLYDLNIDALMLIKNRDVIDTIVKVAKYIGNAREWNVSEEEVFQHEQKACQIRRKARSVFYMFKTLFTIPNGKTFQEVYIKEVNKFLAKTKDKSCFQIINESTTV